MNASRWLGLALIGLALIGVTGTAHAQTLEESLAAAYQQSPQLTGERARLRATDEKVPQALAHTRPTITANATYGSVHETGNLANVPTSVQGGQDQAFYSTSLPSKSYGVTLNQPIFRGGQTLAEFRQAKALIAAERYKLAQAEAQVLLQAASDYVDIVQYQGLLALSENRVTTLEADVKQAQGRYSGGSLTRTDLAQSQAAQIDALGTRAQAQVQLARARAAYARDTGLTATYLKMPELPPTFLPPSLDEAIRLAQQQAPLVLAADYTLRAASQQVRLAVGQSLPSLSVQGTLEHQEGVNFASDRSDIRAVVLQLRVPLYAGGATSSRVREARDNVAVERSALDQARQQSDYSISEAWAQLESAKVTLDAYTAQASINETALTGIRLEASTGERTVQDVLLAEQTLFESRIKIVQASHDIFVARFTLAALLGHLSGQLLDLPVTYYDPKLHYKKVRFGIGP